MKQSGLRRHQCLILLSLGFGFALLPEAGASRGSASVPAPSLSVPSPQNGHDDRSGRNITPDPIYIPTSVVGDPPQVASGQTCVVTVGLNSAPSVEKVVYLSTDHPEVFVNFPTTVTVAAGTSYATFQVQTRTVSGSVTAHISASLSGEQAQGNVVVQP